MSLPSSWIKELGITADDRKVELSFDGKTITISKRLTLAEFISQKCSLDHKQLIDALQPFLPYYASRDRGIIMNRVSETILTRQKTL